MYTEYRRLSLTLVDKNTSLSSVKYLLYAVVDTCIVMKSKYLDDLFTKIYLLRSRIDAVVAGPSPHCDASSHHANEKLHNERSRIVGPKESLFSNLVVEYRAWIKSHKPGNYL